jgi:hypothetical protein
MIIVLVFVFGIFHVGFTAPPAVRIVAVLPLGILLLTWYRRLRWTQIKSDVWICEQCNTARDNNVFQGKCICGGPLTPLPEMKWLETTTSTSLRPSSDANVKSPGSLSRAV